MELLTHAHLCTRDYLEHGLLHRNHKHSNNVREQIHSYNKIYREQSIPMTALWCPAFSYHGEFIMPETQQPIIVIILIIYSPYLLKDLVEL